MTKAFGYLKIETGLVIMGRRHPEHHYQSIENRLVVENAPRAVLEAYSKCRFVVVPSVYPEPFGTVTLEAMSYKKAVIASRTGGLTDVVVDGETGILVPPNDPEALTSAMNYLLENLTVAEGMGQKGYERWRQNFTPEVVAPQIEELYQSLIS